MAQLKVNYNPDHKKRDKSMDELKLFAIYLVIWGHAIQINVTGSHVGDAFADIFFRAIYAFHMPLFMGIVGYFAANLGNLPFHQMICKKSRQLLLPVLTFSMIGAITNKLCYGWDYRWIRVWGSLWFLKAAFVCCVFWWCATRNKRFKWIGIAATLLVSCFWNWGALLKYTPKINDYPLLMEWNIPRMYISFVTGALLYQYKDFAFRHQQKFLITSGILFILLWTPMILSKNFHFTEYSEIFEHLTIWYGHAVGCLSVVFFILLFKFLGEKVPETRIGNEICSWGSMTLSIYCLQWLILQRYMLLFIDFQEFSYWPFVTITSNVISIVILLTSVCITKLLRKNRWTAFLFLGRPLQEKMVITMSS